MSKRRRAAILIDGSSPRKRRLSMVPGETPSSRAASRRSTSMGENVGATSASLGTRHPAFLPLGERLLHGDKVEHPPPPGTDARQAARVGLTPEPGGRKPRRLRQRF